ACETVIDGTTGLLFDEQSADAVVRAVERFEAREPDFDPRAIRAHATGFSPERFRESFSRCVETAWSRFRDGRGEGGARRGTAGPAPGPVDPGGGAGGYRDEQENIR
ncbi:MAG TPA: hypothetical protein VFA95_03425, partial [Gammaproteobacteria bacterium]|nr:hypothetical protein [Gammaproteobacteria bacterium]